MMTNLTSRPMTDLQQRRLLCDDLEYCVLEDKTLLSHIIDDYVYRLTDDEILEYGPWIGSILGEDD